MRQCVIAILLACCMALPVFARRAILLKGKWPPIKRSMSIYPIQAFVENQSKTLSLEFTDDLGLLSVSVSDVNGNIVYMDVIDGMDDTSVNIALDQEMKGQFILSVTNNESEICGEFFIN